MKFKKHMFRCIGCDFEAVTDKVPYGFYHCSDCQITIGFCRRCINIYVKRHLIREHNNVHEDSSDAIDVQRRAERRGGSLYGDHA